MTYKTFETERLFLLPTLESDAEFIMELFNSPKWIKYIGDRKVNSIEDAQNYIKTKMVNQLERLGYSSYTIVRKEDNAKIGVCGLYDREGLEGIDIGFALLEKYEKNGYAFEAVIKLKKVASEIFKINKLSAITTKDNYPSQKLLNKLEFGLKGTKTLPNENVELLMYEIVFD